MFIYLDVYDQIIEIHKSCAEHAVEPASVNRTLHYDYPLSSSTLLTSNSCT